MICKAFCRPKNRWKAFLIYSGVATIIVVCVIVALYATEYRSDDNQDYNSSLIFADSIIPIEYFVQLTPLVTANNYTINGVVNIIATVENKTSEIVLHADMMEIHNVTVLNLTKNMTKPSKLYVKDIVTEHEFLNITLKSSIRADTNISIQISYMKMLNEESWEFYKNLSRTIDPELGLSMGPQLTPTWVQRVFPYFDDCVSNATFHLTILASPDSEYNSSRSDNNDLNNNNTEYRSYNDTNFKPSLTVADSIIPIEYFVQLTPVITPYNYTINGIVNIIATVENKTSEIVLHANMTKIYNVIVLNLTKNTTKPINFYVEHIVTEHEFLNVTLKSPIRANTNISILISYMKILNEETWELLQNLTRTINPELGLSVGPQLTPSWIQTVIPYLDVSVSNATFHVIILPSPNSVYNSSKPANIDLNNKKGENMMQ